MTQHANLKARRFMERAQRQALAPERECCRCDHALEFADLGVTLCARLLSDSLPSVAVERTTGACGDEGRYWKLRKEVS